MKIIPLMKFLTSMKSGKNQHQEASIVLYRIRYKKMKRLLQIQQELKAPKSQFNNFWGYKYRSCEDILTAVKPLLKKYGLIINLTDNITHVGDRYYVEAVANLFDDEGNLIKYAVWYAREEESKKWMDWSQITWSSSSYARKYALNGLFAIDDGIDSDTTNKWKEEEDDKAWFNKEQLDAFVKVATKYADADEALKVIKSKYKIWKEKEAEVRKLYKSLDTINDNN